MYVQLYIRTQMHMHTAFCWWIEICVLHKCLVVTNRRSLEVLTPVSSLSLSLEIDRSWMHCLMILKRNWFSVWPQMTLCWADGLNWQIKTPFIEEVISQAEVSGFLGDRAVCTSDVVAVRTPVLTIYVAPINQSPSCNTILLFAYRYSCLSICTISSTFFSFSFFTGFLTDCLT